MPANTPSPIGRTSSFFPGSVNGVAEADASAAAAVAETGVVEDAEDAGAALTGAAVDAGRTEPDLVAVPCEKWIHMSLVRDKDVRRRTISLAGPPVAVAEEVAAEVAAEVT
jgi:hypothetical protein